MNSSQTRMKSYQQFTHEDFVNRSAIDWCARWHNSSDKGNWCQRDHCSTGDPFDRLRPQARERPARGFEQVLISANNLSDRGDQTLRSKRSRSMTLVQAAMKSLTNF